MRRYFIYVSLVAGFVISSCSVFEATVDSREPVFQNFIKQLSERGQFNGNVLVAEKGNIIFETSVGVNSVKGDSLSLQSQFRLASVSKQFTAMSIMILREAGKLDYDDPIKKYIPEWPYDATIRNLLNHTSGTPDYESLFEEYWKPELKSDDPARTMQGNEHMVSFIVENHPAVRFKPGEKYEYSNTAYVLLATIVQRVSGIPFEEFMRENIFIPAGMNDTYVYSPLREDPLKHRVYGFKNSLDGNELIENDYNFLNPVAGDGGIYSTLKDLYSWDRTLYTDKLISQNTLQDAYKPALLNNGDTSRYGFGWGIIDNDMWGKTVAHSGGWVGFRTWIERELDQENCVIILTNNSSIYLGEIRVGLTHILHGEDYELPKISAAEELGQVVINFGIDKAKSRFGEMKADSVNYNIVEWQINSLGYQLMGIDKKQEALAIFNINTNEFPDSANAWDSQGDGYLALGDTVMAISSFQKALEIDTDMLVSKEKLDKINKP